MSSATNISTLQLPMASFSRAMDPSTITGATFTLKQGTAAVDGGVTLDAALTTATFAPAQPLAMNTLYTATITTGARANGGPALASNRTWTFTTALVDVRSAHSFSVLGTAVTNTGATTLTGDLGVTDGGSIAGFPPGMATGAESIGGPEVNQATNDVVAAYTAAAALASTGPIGSPVLGLTLTPGIYKSTAALTIGSSLTLDGQGDPDAVFIFQIGAALDTTAMTSRVDLKNGTRASNVFWQVNGAVTLGANSIFRGTILANAAITAGLATIVEGRLLTSSGLITLATNTIGMTIRDGGYGSLNGSSAFEVKACRAFARSLPDGSPDFSRVTVSLANVKFACPSPTVGPGTALTLDAHSTDAGAGKGAFAQLNPDGGAPTSVEFPTGSFSIQWGADPTRGITGTVGLTLIDGGTIQGRFAGSYCGAY